MRLLVSSSPRDVCNAAQNRTVTLGFGVQRQGDPWACPAQYNKQRAMCDSLRDAGDAAAAAELLVPSDAAFDATLAAAAKLTGGTVALTVATYDYAEGALLWYRDLLSKGMPAGVVVAMDVGAFKYLRNRAVPAVLMQTQMHLFPCCLRRFRMVPWRSTNDVKVRCAAHVSKQARGLGVSRRGGANAGASTHPRPEAWLHRDHAGHGHVAQRRGSECDAATPNRRHRVRSLTIAPAVAATT